MKNKDTIKISQELDGVTYTYEFRTKVSFLVWKQFFKNMYQQQTVEAVKVIIKNQMVRNPKVENIFGADFNNNENIIYFVGDILTQFMPSEKVILYKSDDSAKGKEIAKKYAHPVYTLTINDNTLYLRSLRNDEYSDLFNQILTDPLGAWDYIYNNVVVEKTKEIDKDSYEYASANTVPSLLVNIKKISLKKN